MNAHDVNRRNRVKSVVRFLANPRNLSLILGLSLLCVSTADVLMHIIKHGVTTYVMMQIRRVILPTLTILCTVWGFLILKRRSGKATK